LIVVETLVKAFGRRGDVRAVDSVAFTAGDGQITGLLGPTGAGTPTLLRMRATLNQLLASATGQNVERVARDVDRDYIMSPEQGVEYGMIDRVITSRDTAPTPVAAKP